MAGELSKVLDHIEKIGELGPRRRRADVARRRGRERAARRRAAAVAAARRRRSPPRPTSPSGGFRVPSPGAAMSDELLELTAAQAAERDPRRRARPPASCSSAYRERAAARRPQRLHRGSPTAAPEPSATRAAGRRPDRGQGPLLHRGRAEPGRLEDPRGLPPAVHRDRRRAARAGAGAPLLGKTNQDEFAMGSSTENSAYGPIAEPVGPRRACPAARRGGSAAAVAAGLAPWAIGTDTGGSIRQPAALCGIVGLKPTYGAVSRYGMIAFASSLDQAGPFTRDVDRRRAAAAAHGRPRPVRLDVARPARAGRAADARATSTGIRLGVPEELTGEGIEPGVLRGASTRRSTLAERARRDASRRCTLPHAPHALAAYYLIAPAEARRNLARFDGVRYGPRVDGRTTCSRCTRSTRARGLRRRGQAPHHARHLRAVVRLLRRLLRPRAEGAHEDRRGLPRRVRELRLRRHADLADRRVQARRPRPTTRSRCTSTTYCTVPMSLAGIPAISIPDGLSRRPAGRLPARRPGVQREPAPRRRARARAGDRLRRLPGVR